MVELNDKEKRKLDVIKKVFIGEFTREFDTFEIKKSR